MCNRYNFTERVRKVLAMSREEAYALNLEYDAAWAIKYCESM